MLSFYLLFLDHELGTTTKNPLKGDGEYDMHDHEYYRKSYNLSQPGSVISGASIRIDRIPMLQSAMNLANSVIGIGNLGFPYLFY